MGQPEKDQQPERTRQLKSRYHVKNQQLKNQLGENDYVRRWNNQKEKK